MKRQKGCIVKPNKKHRSWFGRWYEDVLLPDGTRKRKLVTKKLADFSDQYRSKADVRPLLDDLLKPVNDGKVTATSHLTIADYWESTYLPYLKQTVRKSTLHGYKQVWMAYVKNRVGRIRLRDFTAFDAQRALDALADPDGIRYQQETDADAIHAKLEKTGKGLNSLSLRHIKALMSGLFAHAIRNGVLFAAKPVREARVPSFARETADIEHYSLNETLLILQALKSQPMARAAVALMFYCGLRPSEAKGLTWELYDPAAVYDKDTQQFEARISVKRGVWRKEPGRLKTSTSRRILPVNGLLKAILTELRATEKNPSGYILHGDTGQPLNLENLSRRVIRPSLALCQQCGKAKHETDGHEFLPYPEWRGWYAFRRGVSTTAAEETGNLLGSKGLLGHKNIGTTAAHYLGHTPVETVNAMALIEQRTREILDTQYPEPLES